MNPEQFGELVGELRAIKLTLFAAATFVTLSVALAAYRTYTYVKHYVVKGLDDLFRTQGLDLLETGRLDDLICECQRKLLDRPNHAYAYRYLGRAYFLQGRWHDARSEFETLRRISPNWQVRSIPTSRKSVRRKANQTRRPRPAARRAVSLTAEPMTVTEAVRQAAERLPGRAAPAGRIDPRWQAIIAVGEFVMSEPEAVWRFIRRWGSHASQDLRAAIATCLLEHLLEHHFDLVFSRVERLAERSARFADTLGLCARFGSRRYL